MNIRIDTEVDGHYLDVIDRFDRKLFEALAPPFPKMNIKKFTGSKKGDRIHIEFLPPLKNTWISDIIEEGRDTSKAYFIDEGIALPFPLKRWKHIHSVEKINNTKSRIVDDIYYKAGIFTLWIFPFLYFSFYGRKKIYREFFKKNQIGIP